MDFDPKNLQLSPEQVAQWTAKGAVSRRPPRQIGHFVMGPIPLAWLGPATRLPGKALAVGLAIWYLRGLKKLERVWNGAGWVAGISPSTPIGGAICKPPKRSSSKLDSRQRATTAINCCNLQQLL